MLYTESGSEVVRGSLGRHSKHRWQTDRDRQKIWSCTPSRQKKCNGCIKKLQLRISAAITEIIWFHKSFIRLLSTYAITLCPAKLFENNYSLVLPHHQCTLRLRVCTHECACVHTLMVEVVANVSRSKGGQTQSATKMELDCMKRQQQLFHPLKFTPLHMDWLQSY